MSFSFITGIDIGHYSIKAVVLKPVKGTLTLSAYRELTVEQSIFSDNHLLSYQEIVNKLKELRKSLPLFSHKVALSLPDNAVITKQVHIDKGLSPQERDYAIIEAFSHQSPLELDELSLDYCQLNAEKESHPSHLIQVYATKKELVENRQRICRKAGLRPVLFEVHAHSLVRLWQAASQRTQRDHWLLIDVGHTHCIMVMDLVEPLPLTKILPIGTATGAEFFEQFIERIERHLPLIGAMSAVNLAGIWLTGGGANKQGLAESLSHRLNLACELLDPLSLFSADHEPVETLPMSSALTVPGYCFAAAVGLALLGRDWQEKNHAC